MDPDQVAPLGASDLGPHCLPVCKKRFVKFARIFIRQHKQTTFSDAGVLRVNYCFMCLFHIRLVEWQIVHPDQKLERSDLGLNCRDKPF